MAQFFSDKASNIHEDLKKSLDPANPYIPVRSELDQLPTEELCEFSSVTIDETKDIVMESPCKHCDLDPFLTYGVKKLIDCLASPISIIINKSLSSGHVPKSMKKELRWTRVLAACREGSRACWCMVLAA